MKKIDEIVNRFLSWKLPEDFNPDGGISFTRTYNGYIDGVFAADIERKQEDPHWPIGTNLFTAEQAKQMLLEILRPDEEILELLEKSDENL